MECVGKILPMIIAQWISFIVIIFIGYWRLSDKIEKGQLETFKIRTVLDVVGQGNMKHSSEYGDKISRMAKGIDDPDITFLRAYLDQSIKIKHPLSEERIIEILNILARRG